MNPLLEATETTPTADRTVRDYDELDDGAAAALPEAVDGDAIAISQETADDFADGEVVRFTGYYRVTIAE